MSQSTNVPAKKGHLQQGLVFKMIALCFASSAVFEVPYLSWAYYDPMMEALELSNMQMGSLMTVYGLAALACRFPGGWLADILPERVLVCLSLVVTGILGFFVIFHPPYLVCLLIWGAMGISAVLPMWAAIIKANRQLGDSTVQGRIFGFFEAGRSLIPLLYWFAVTAIFDYSIGVFAGDETKAMNVAVVILTIISMISAVLMWLAFKPKGDTPKTIKEQTNTVKWKDIKFVLRLPGVWTLALIIFCSYIVYVSMSFITPYTTEVYGASSTVAAVLANFRSYGVGIVGAVIAGWIADRVGSTSKVIAISFVCIAVGLMTFYIAPVGERYLWICIVIMMIVAFVIFVPRGIYFALVDELGIPIEYTGAAVGVASFIGYCPDAFAYTVIGNWLDKYPGIKGFHVAFGFMAAVSIVGFIITLIMYRLIKKQRALEQVEDRPLSK